MAYYITLLTQALAATAIACALWPAATQDERERWTRALPWALAAGIVLGVTAVLVAATGSRRVAAVAAGFVHGGALAASLAAVAAILLCPFRPRPPLLREAGLAVVALLAAQGLFVAWRLGANHSLTAAGVINTEAIVNSAAIAIALALIAALFALAGGVARLAGRRVVVAVLVLVLALVAVGATESTMLNLLRLDALAVTPGRVSFVARLSLVTPWLAYAQIAALLALLAAAFLARARMPGAVKRPVERRSFKARMLGEGRLRRGLAFTGALLIAVMAYQDLYASRPPTLSPAAPVAADAQGEIRIPVDAVRDGRLHRFAYVTSGGTRVRFFLVNKFDAPHVHIGVVYDACVMCGEGGYIQRGDEIICIACNVRIFRPSIGRAGGCNPIPLDHRTEDGVIAIAAAELESGARHFSEVLEIEVVDPVSGARLDNLTAPHQFEFRGRTYFFEGRETWERFRAAPETFVTGHGA